METLDSIVNLECGAKFYRADLHIHSYGASHDVKDQLMTPEAIVSTAHSENIDVIAITDHNEITNVERALNAAQSLGILVLPGVELSTPQGHLLAYLPTLESLHKFYNRLSIADRQSQVSRCQTSMLDCLKIAADFNGFSILAHVDGPKGLEVEIPGNSPHKVDILCHSALLGIELKSSASDISYSDADPDKNRRQIGGTRIEKLGLGAKQILARTLFSDSHTLNALGKNAQGDRKITRIKMDRPSFHAVRIALQDSDARVRIEEHIPDAVPYILGAHFEGGFLDGQAIHFSRNLNCIIGGRGTGKSTTFEAVRCLTGEPSDNSVIDSEVWPGELSLFWEDAASQRHSLLRRAEEGLENLDDPFLGPIEFPIDCYGQGETAKISQQAQSNPAVLLQYLDKFVDISAYKEGEEKALNQLRELQEQINEAEEKVALIPQYERYVATTKQQLNTLEQAQAREIIELQRKLAEEKEIRNSIAAQLQNLKTLLLQPLTKEATDSIREFAEQAQITVGAAEYQHILTAVSAFETRVGQAEHQLHESVKALSTVVSEQLRAWGLKESATLRKIEEKRKQLEAQGIRLDMSFIQSLARDAASYAQTLTTLRKWVPHLSLLKKQHAAVLKKRWEARERIGMIREAYGQTASKALQSSLSDLQVSLRFVRHGYSPEAVKLIHETMGWRTIQVPRASLLVEKLTVPRILEAIDRIDSAPFAAIETSTGVKLFSLTDAAEIIERLSQPAIRFALECCPVEDLPRLIIRRNLGEKDGRPQYAIRNFSQLSLGQQQSILLALMLSSDRSVPLIIDQPEDNLDSEFIYHSLVPVLRRAKERRQIIIVTHNANIAVLGDAEQIIVLKSQSDHGGIAARGSIDDPTTRDAACNILEGAREAFLQRSKIYGV